MDEKGANTFPFHNLPPELKKQSQRSFLCFFTFPFWIKEKSVTTLANRNIYDQTQNIQVSSSTVSQNANKVLDFLKIFHVLKVFGVFEKMSIFEDGL